MGRGLATSYLTFSCEQYQDPEHTGFRALRAINEDVVAHGTGLSHAAGESMDMLSCVLEGELDLVGEDGGRRRLQPGSLARTRASRCAFAPIGRGRSRVLQVWIEAPADARARDAQVAMPAAESRGKLQLVASPDGRDGTLALQQDTSVYAATLRHGDRLEHALPAGRHAWVQVLSGVVEVNGHLLTQSDGAAVSSEELLQLFARRDSELMLFEMP